MQNLPTNSQPNTPTIRSAVIRRASQTVKSRESFPVTVTLLGGRIAPQSSADEKCECEHCAESDYSGIYLNWQDLRSDRGELVADYDVTDCDGVWLCAHHAAEVEARG